VTQPARHLFRHQAGRDSTSYNLLSLGETLCKCWKSQAQIHVFVFSREFVLPVVCAKQWRSQPTTFWG